MSDFELLEAAARAAGLAVEWDWYAGDGEDGTMVTANGYVWNPLAHDDHALQLAVKLRMRVEPWGSGAAAVVSVDNRAMVAEPHYGDDPERATRRAIVRAAAQMAQEQGREAGA